MIDDTDIDAAVAGGALDEASAARLRKFSASRNVVATTPDDENFRLITGFSDIFVTLALFMAVAIPVPMAFSTAPVATMLLAAAAAWGFSDYFVRKRRMALPSIFLVATFMAACGAAGFLLHVVPAPDAPAGLARWASGMFATKANAAIGILATSLAGAAHWYRFRVPITVSFSLQAALVALYTLATLMFPGLDAWHAASLVILGTVLFAAALWWDASDTVRATRRSDVAFWLHLAAAPLLVHPVFQGLANHSAGAGSMPGSTLGDASLVLAVYAFLAAASLVLDRRALMVSGLVYLLFSIRTVFLAAAGLFSGSPLAAPQLFVLACAAIGLGFLLIAAGWQRLRGVLVRRLPASIQRLVPPVGTAAA